MITGGPGLVGSPGRVDRGNIPANLIPMIAWHNVDQVFRLRFNGRDRLGHHGAASCRGNVALALLCNRLATGAILPVIILMFGAVFRRTGR